MVVNIEVVPSGKEERIVRCDNIDEVKEWASKRPWIDDDPVYSAGDCAVCYHYIPVYYNKKLGRWVCYTGEVREKLRVEIDEDRVLLNGNEYSINDLGWYKKIVEF